MLTLIIKATDCRKICIRIIVEIEESVDMEDVSVILDLVETSVNLVKHVLIIV